MRIIIKGVWSAHNSDPDAEGSRDDTPVRESALTLGGVAEDDKGGLVVVEDISEVKGSN